jgi:enoyl-CoA hydratase/carnithine racemase
MASPDDAPPLLRTDQGGIVTLTLNRPRQLNLLTREMLDALAAAFAALTTDAGARVVVLAAAGRGFCAGHDVKEIQALGGQPEIAELFRQCARVMLAIPALPQPVIARVHGVAAAAGCQLVAQCDLAVASTDARFTTPGVDWGFFCSTPAVPIGRNLLRKHAMEMVLTGDAISAEQALAWGLVNRVVAPDALDAATGDLARRIADKPRETVAAGKRVFYQQLDAGLARAYELTGETIAASFTSEEGREGMAAFIEKRKPAWKR